MLESLFLKKLQASGPVTLLKKRLQHECFPVKFAKFLRTPILKNICKQLPSKLLNPFHVTVLFLYPLKIPKTSGFQMFSGGIERDRWHELG